MSILPQDIRDILEESLGEKITEYQITLGEANSGGMGFLSELVFISLSHKATGDEHHVVIKQALPTGGAASMRMVRSAFANEISFYRTCWPTLRNFQENYPLAEPFRCIPKCYGATGELEKEKLVLENLKHLGFSVYERRRPFDLEHMKAVFRAYAEFHAISMAFRVKESEGDFDELVKPLENLWLRIADAMFFRKLIEGCCKMLLGKVEPELREKIGKKLDRYMDGNLMTIVNECAGYKGECPVMVHGDCWSSNFMFKYDESREISELKLIDFQITRRGSPVHDLSYCFYSCASEAILQNLDKLLSIYHDTLSRVLERYGCAAEEIYPMLTLKEEWRQYSKFGLMVGIMVWRSKFTDAKDVADFNRLIDNDMEELNKPRQTDSEGYSQKVCDILLHAYENDKL